MRRNPERWFWGIDFFIAGGRAINDHAGWRELVMVAFKAAWEQIASLPRKNTSPV
jgi:hypothetical protein